MWSQGNSLGSPGLECSIELERVGAFEFLNKGSLRRWRWIISIVVFLQCFALGWVLLHNEATHNYVRNMRFLLGVSWILLWHHKTLITNSAVFKMYINGENISLKETLRVDTTQKIKVFFAPQLICALRDLSNTMRAPDMIYCICYMHRLFKTTACKYVIVWPPLTVCMLLFLTVRVVWLFFYDKTWWYMLDFFLKRQKTAASIDYQQVILP